MRGYSFLRLVFAGMELDCLDMGLIPDQSAISESIDGVPFTWLIESSLSNDPQNVSFSADLLTCDRNGHLLYSLTLTHLLP